MKRIVISLALFLMAGSSQGAIPKTYWMKIRAIDRYQRSLIADKGVSIEIVKPDYVVAFGNEVELEAVKDTGLLETSFVYDVKTMDFPTNDSNFHNYNELLAEMKGLVAAHPNLVAYEVIGKSLEGRDIVNLRISSDLKNSSKKPGISFMGTHHAREHVSTELPLNLAQYLLSEYVKGNAQVVNLVDNREINIIPLVNPDGAEYDVATGDYQAWRKNRRNNGDGTYGVDLNRNYGYNWGQGGASPSPSSDTYRGASAFSEPETQVIKNFIESKTNITELLSFHTFSELVLYPWGYTYSAITDLKDHQVFQTMAKTMAAWNGYTPEQSSALYITSGDTTDWAYGTHKIFAFTFELDPADAWGVDGFYPGQAAIPVVFQKNLKPCLYMIDLADNPYRASKSTSQTFGLNSPMF